MSGAAPGHHPVPAVLLAGVAPDLATTLAQALVAAGYAPVRAHAQAPDPAVIVATRPGARALPPVVTAGAPLVILDDETGADETGAAEGTVPDTPFAILPSSRDLDAILDTIASAYASTALPARRLADRLAAHDGGGAPRRGIEAVLDLAIREASDSGLVGGCAVLYRDEARSHWLCAETGNLAHGFARWLGANAATLPWLDALASGRAVMIGELARDAHFGDTLPRHLARDRAVPGALLAVPLALAGRPFGALVWFPDAPGRPSPGALGRLRRFAEQVAGTLREAQLLLVAEGRDSAMIAAQQLGLAVGRRIDGEAAAAIGDLTRGLLTLFDYAEVAIYLRDGEDLARRGFATRDAGGTPPAERLIMGRGLAGKVAVSGVPAHDGRAIAVPIGGASAVLGVLRARLPAGHRRSATDTLARAGVLETCAAHLGAALERAAARAEAERRAAGLAALVAVGTTIAAQRDYDALLATIDQQIARLIPSEEAGIFRTDPATGDLVAERLRLGVGDLPARLPRGVGLCGWVAEHGEPLLTNDPQGDPRFYRIPGDHQLPSASLVAPLPGPRGSLGVICLNRYTHPAFTPLDLELLAAFGQQVAVVIAQARLREEREARVAELEALNEVAGTLASLDLDHLLTELATRAGALLDAHQCGINLLDEDGTTLTVRATVGHGGEQLVGTVVPVEGSFTGTIIRSARPQEWDEARDGPNFALFGPHRADNRPRAVIGAPLIAQGRVIGAMIATRRQAGGFSEANRRFLATVAAQAAVAVENARLYADTLRLARYDPLTGLANRRYLMETLAAAVEVATRYERPLALLVIDLDRFKGINDTYGHLAGDALLRDVAGRLRARLRQSDIPARYAGDELAVILPETTLAGALALAERLRAAVADTPFPVGEGRDAALTLSIGVGEHFVGGTIADLLQAADSAMYFAKHGGRDRVCGPEAARAALDRAPEQLAAVLAGGNQVVIEELAAAVDARVPLSAGQAARVATVAVALGAALGLPEADQKILRSAALVHDLGEVAISPDILGRAGPLDSWEWTLVRAHPRHGHDLLADVPAFREALPLILHHHERWDGTGYPEGLAGEAIPHGARIIAVADAWVALTTDRPHRPARSRRAALGELHRHAGSQFDPAIVAALPRALALADPAGAREFGEGDTPPE